MQGILPLAKNREIAKNTVPSMAYDGKEDFAAWQARARAKLEELLGLPFERCDDQLTIEWKKELEEYTEIRFLFQSETNYFVPAVLRIPNGAEGPLPTVICLQGHSRGMHISLGQPKYPGDEKDISGGDRDFCVRSVKEGYCAIAVEQRCFGECGGTEKGPNCQESSLNALLIGRTTAGERVWDIQRLIDVLEKYFADKVDLEKIVCMGNSGGGTSTFYASCLEPRIHYSMPSCAVCEYDDSILAVPHCICNYIPGIRKYFEMGDLTGLIAPRPFVLVSGYEDNIFPRHGVAKTFAKTQALYQAAGAPDNCKLVVGDGGHRFYANDSWPLMNEFLKG